MRALSPAIAIEKNRIASDGVWLVLLEIVLPSPAPTVRLVLNNENITWNGETWVSFPFELDEIGEDSKGELPSVNVRVSNVTRILESYIEEGLGGVGSSVTIRVVNSKLLNTGELAFEEIFDIISASVDVNWVTFPLGSSYSLVSRRPEKRIFKDFCQFAEYGGVECGVPFETMNIYPTCNHTLADCRLRGNSKRFDGEVTISLDGLYV